MKFKIKETTLTDGSKVHDVDLFANGNTDPGTMRLGGKPMCIFSCHDKNAAFLFFTELEKLVEKHTAETLEEV